MLAQQGLRKTVHFCLKAMTRVLDEITATSDSITRLDLRRQLTLLPRVRREGASCAAIGLESDTCFRHAVAPQIQDASTRQAQRRHQIHLRIRAVATRLCPRDSRCWRLRLPACCSLEAGRLPFGTRPVLLVVLCALMLSPAEAAAFPPFRLLGAMSFRI